MPVAARFHELRDRVVGTVDAKFAEPVRLSFMKDGVADPIRGRIEIQAVLRTGGGKTTKSDSGMGKTWRTRVAVGKAELHIDRAVYTGPMPVKGDSVRAISRAGEPAFEVLWVDERNHSRLILELGEK